MTTMASKPPFLIADSMAQDILGVTVPEPDVSKKNAVELTLFGAPKVLNVSIVSGNKWRKFGMQRVVK